MLLLVGPAVADRVGPGGAAKVVPAAALLLFQPSSLEISAASPAAPPANTVSTSMLAAACGFLVAKCF
jgi:hypothetical protein